LSQGNDAWAADLSLGNQPTYDVSSIIRLPALAAQATVTFPATKSC